MLPDLYEYSGVIHIHTECSFDTSGDLKSLVEAADKTKPDFCLITDHNSIEFIKKYGEHVINGCSYICGEEITPPNLLHHLMALNIKDNINPDNNPQINIDNVNKQNGISILCHPHIPEKTLFLFKDVSWKNWDVEGFTGIELWSYMLEWTSQINLTNFILYMLFPHWVVNEPDEDLTYKWDQINKTRKCVCIGGVDAHVKKIIPYGFNKVFRYDFLFNTIRTNIFTKIPMTDSIETNKNIIYDAIRNGNSFISNYEISDSRGFRFFAVSNKTIYSVGDTIIYENQQIVFSIVTSVKCEINLFRNGEIIARIIDTELDYMVNQKGNYRVETVLARRKWIITNNIYVK
ncbi:hypothetical protein KA977_14455 [Candidatus Dependentiae bacterium]|nr:hypothetical protein [Candidatus Dependentiae bacterium]